MKKYQLIAYCIVSMVVMFPLNSQAALWEVDGVKVWDGVLNTGWLQPFGNNGSSSGAGYGVFEVSPVILGSSNDAVSNNNWPDPKNAPVVGESNETILFDAGPYLIAGSNGETQFNKDVSAVPVPAAVWLFGSSLIGLGFVGNRRKRQ